MQNSAKDQQNEPEQPPESENTGTETAVLSDAELDELWSKPPRTHESNLASRVRRKDPDGFTEYS